MKSLYTSIPIDDTLDIITHKLSHDNRLKDQTSLSPQDIRQLLNVCLKTTNFKFRDSFYQLTDGVAMGSPASSHVANLFMEHLEEQAIHTAPSKPKIWKRFVDDIFAIVKRHHKELLAHLNSQHHNITFTTEEETNGQLPFMDALVCRQPNGTLNFKVFCRPTHTGKYLAFDSHHPSSNKKVSFAPFSAAQTESHPIQRIKQRKTGSLRNTYRKMATLLHSSRGTFPDRNDKNPQQLMTLNKEPTHHRIHSFRGQHKPSSGSLRHGIHTK